MVWILNMGYKYKMYHKNWLVPRDVWIHPLYALHFITQMILGFKLSKLWSKLSPSKFHVKPYFEWFWQKLERVKKSATIHSRSHHVRPCRRPKRSPYIIFPIRMRIPNTTTSVEVFNDILDTLIARPRLRPVRDRVINTAIVSLGEVRVRWEKIVAGDAVGNRCGIEMEQRINQSFARGNDVIGFIADLGIHQDSDVADASSSSFIVAIHSCFISAGKQIFK